MPPSASTSASCPHAKSRIKQRGDPAPLALPERVLPKVVREFLQVRDAVDEHGLLVGIRRSQVQLALAHEPHTQRLVQVEVVDAKELDVLFQFREEAVLDADPLVGDLVAQRPALEPIDDVRDADGDDDEEPLRSVVTVSYTHLTLP